MLIYGGKNDLDYGLGLLTLLYEMLAVTRSMMWFLPWQYEQGAVRVCVKDPRATQSED